MRVAKAVSPLSLPRMQSRLQSHDAKFLASLGLDVFTRVAMVVRVASSRGRNVVLMATAIPEVPMMHGGRPETHGRVLARVAGQEVPGLHRQDGKLRSVARLMAVVGQMTNAGQRQVALASTGRLDLAVMDMENADMQKMVMAMVAREVWLAAGEVDVTTMHTARA